jgi:DNA-binding GntR family transcriptional regulator
MIMEVLWNIMGNNMWPLLKQESISKEEQKKKHASQHEAIVNAICAHDAEGAYKAMYAHLLSIRDGIDEVMDKPLSISCTGPIPLD